VTGTRIGLRLKSGEFAVSRRPTRLDTSTVSKREQLNSVEDGSQYPGEHGQSLVRSLLNSFVRALNGLNPISRAFGYLTRRHGEEPIA